MLCDVCCVLCLAACRQEFSQTTSIHVHSVMPAHSNPITDTHRLADVNAQQCKQLYNGLLQQHKQPQVPPAQAQQRQPQGVGVDPAANRGDVLAHNLCSSVSFTAGIAAPAVPQHQQQQQRKDAGTASPEPAANGHTAASDAAAAAAAAAAGAGGAPAAQSPPPAAAAAGGGAGSGAASKGGKAAKQPALHGLQKLWSKAPPKQVWLKPQP